MSSRRGIKRKKSAPLVFELEDCELSPMEDEVLEDNSQNSCGTSEITVNSCDTSEKNESNSEQIMSSTVEILDDSDFVVLSETSEDVQVIESSPKNSYNLSDDVQIIESIDNPDVKTIENDSNNVIVISNDNDTMTIQEEKIDVQIIETKEIIVGKITNLSEEINDNIKVIDKDNIVKADVTNEIVKEVVTININNSDYDTPVEKVVVDDRIRETEDLQDDEPDGNEAIIKISFSSNKVLNNYKSKFQIFLKTLTNCTFYESANEIHVFGHENSPRSKKKKKNKNKKELFVVDSTPCTDDIRKPKYDRKCQVIEAPVGLENEEKIEVIKNNFFSSCFNCSGNHSLKDCPEPKDFNKIRINRQKKMNTNKWQKLVRYHEEGNNGRPEIPAGNLSDKLRIALGLRKNAIPEYIYRMRVMGYPPGWLEEAKTSGSNLAIFFDEGKVDNGNVQPDGIDPLKIISYPGFNVKAEKSVRDEYKIYNVPKFSEDFSKEAMVKYFINLQSQMQDNVEVCDMDIDKEEEQPSPPGCNTEEATKIKPEEEKEVETKETGKISPSLEDLEIQKKELLEKLVDTSTNGDVNDTNEADKSSTPSTPRNQIIKSSLYGTPILKSTSPYSSLPKSDNFSKDVSPVINFENLPNSTGSYDKMVGVLEKVRKTLKNVQESG